MMKRVLLTALVAAAMLVPSTASAKDQVLVCRGGKFRLIVNAKDKGPVLAAKFKKYSTSKAFVKATSGAHKGKYPYHKLQTGQCAIIDGKFAKKAETHFAYKFKSPVDLCSTFLFPKYQTKDVHLDLKTTKKTSFQDKSLLLGLSRNDLLFKMKVFVANKGSKHAYFVVKDGLGAYKRTKPEKMLYGPAWIAVAGAGGGPSSSCMQDGVQKYFKVK